MQKEKNIYTVKKIIKNEAVIAVGINIIFLVFFSSVFGIHFETNDDPGMACIPAGATGITSSKIVFINAIIGKILKLVTCSIPFINWYTIFQLSIVFISLSGISYVLLKKDKIFGIIATFFLVSYIGFEGYVNMQFTKTAGIGSVAGIIAIAYALENKSNILIYIYGCITLVLGSCYRFEACGLALMISSIVGIAFLYRNIKNKNELKTIIKYVLGWGLPLFLVVIAKFVDNYAYNSVTDYKEYRSYTSLRAELLDHGFPDYDLNEKLYQELNISREDLQLFQNWNFADPDIFNTNSMTKLVAAKEKKQIDLKFIQVFFSKISKGIFLENAFIIFLICSLILMLFDRKLYKVFIWNIIVYIFIEFYFYYTDRYLLHRVEVVVWLSEIMLMLYYCNVECIRGKLKLRQCIMLLVLSLVINSDLYAQKIVSPQKDWDYYRSILKSIDMDDDHLYVLCTLDELVNMSYDAMDVIPYGIRDNITLLGGWGTELPTEKFVLSKYGIRNTFKDIVNNENVYIAGYGDLQAVLGYIQRHYYPDAYLEYVYNINSLCVYKIIASSK